MRMENEEEKKGDATCYEGDEGFCRK